jgi:hypothetical protein
MYLNVGSANNMAKLKKFVHMAKKSYINTLVMDVQSSKYKKCIVPKANIQYCKDNGLHPVARIVIFPDGLKKYPVTKAYINNKLDIAQSACENGFREIQFDYIRFHDSGSTRHLTYEQKYAFIEGFIMKVRNRLKNYNVRFAADVFGRIPLNKNDIIGQKMESLDKVLDIICPMAYPSHYSWSKKFYANPYYTVHTTSMQAKKRTQNAMIVTYIQAFKMKMCGIPFDKYVYDQIKAVHDSGVSGYFLWNARQQYSVPLAVMRRFYKSRLSARKDSDGPAVD